MANKKIENVLLKKDGLLKSINLEEMTRNFFEENREYLHCPNEKCNANIDYCEGPKRKFFRTAKSIQEGSKIIEQHIDNCPYELNHNINIGPKTIYDMTTSSNLSDSHITSSLKNAFQKKKKEVRGGSKSKSKYKRNNVTPIHSRTEEVIIKGKASISVDNEKTESKKREPNLYKRDISEIVENDYGTPKLVMGFIKKISYKENSITIELETKNNTKGRIYFSEFFKVHNTTEFEEMKYYKQYIDTVESLQQKIFIACAGDVKKDEFDISVHVVKQEHIRIDDMSHNYLITNLIKGKIDFLVTNRFIYE